jgi:hypothetical protein
MQAGSIMAAGAGNAAKEQEYQGLLGLQTANNIYDRNEAKLQPYEQTGNQAETELQRGMGPQGSLGRQFTMADFVKDPAYQFDLKQGLEAINNSNSVRGGALSGGTLKALSNYGQQQASNEFGNARDYFMRNQNQNFSQLSGLAGQGLNATNIDVGLGQHLSDSTLDERNSIGNAKAAGVIGRAKGEAQAAQGMWSSIGSLGTMAMGS